MSQAGAGKPDASFEPWKIDLVSISPDGSTVNLYIVAEQPLTGSDGQLRSLQEKIHNYVGYVLDGQMSREIPLGVPKQRTVLASLLLHPNNVVPAEDLIDQVWRDDPPNTARKTLQGYVTHLRRVLGPDRLEWRAPGYVLRVGPRELDADRFESLVHEAKAANARPDQAAALYRRALEQWRGPALADLAGEGALATEAHRLEELHLEALEGRIAADLDAGRHGELIAELAALTAEQPLRERLWGSAHARAVPLGPAGRGERGVPPGSRGARRRARPRSVRRAPGPSRPNGPTEGISTVPRVDSSPSNPRRTHQRVCGRRLRIGLSYPKACRSRFRRSGCLVFVPMGPRISRSAD